MCSVYDVVHFKRRNSQVETRYTRKTGEKRSCKHFNEFIVPVMLVGYLKFEIHAAGNYHKVKNIQVMLQNGLSLSLSFSLSL